MHLHLCIQNTTNPFRHTTNYTTCTTSATHCLCFAYASQQIPITSQNVMNRYVFVNQTQRVFYGPEAEFSCTCLLFKHQNHNSKCWNEIRKIHHRGPARKMKTYRRWDAAPCTLPSSPKFRTDLLVPSQLSPWGWRQRVAPKRWCSSTKPRIVTTQKTLWTSLLNVSLAAVFMSRPVTIRDTNVQNAFRNDVRVGHSIPCLCRLCQLLHSKGNESIHLI